MRLWITAVLTVFSLARPGAAEEVKKIRVDPSRFSDIYPAVWFSPSTGEISPIKEKSEKPPEEKYEIWIEPNDPEFAFLRGAREGVGFALLGYGDDVFGKPQIPKEPKLDERLD